MNGTMDFISRSQNYKVMNKKKMWIISIAVLFLLILFSISFLSKTVTAQRDGGRVKLVTSIEVKKGDTLWSIASNYISDEYNNISAYVEEIKDSNGLISDTIHTGNYIIVPYYADASN